VIPNRLYCVASLLLLLLLLQAYKDSKLCNMLFMAEAARRTPRLGLGLGLGLGWLGLGVGVFMAEAARRTPRRALTKPGRADPG